MRRSVPLSMLSLEAHNPGPMRGSGTNTYLIVGYKGSAVLIDSGIGDPRHLAALDRALEANWAHLTRVLVTHGHPDHASGAPALAASHRRAAFAKCPWPGEDIRYPVEWQPLAEGDRIAIDEEELEVLHTPGHTPDHLVFWHQRTTTAFTGDLVLPGGRVMIDWSHGGNLAQYLAALERLLGLGLRRLLPGHGPEMPDASAVLTAHLEHRRMRERQVVAALQANRATVRAIAESIYDDLDPELMPAACENVQAHLELLKIEGRASEEAGRWRI
jgi:glyoxylase-like metal-dependent hydrolase (beta-lactamase superfamily II)